MIRSIVPSLVALALLLATSWPVCADEVRLPPREKFHLYLLIGQSNMAGRGQITADDPPPHPRVLKLDAEGHWQPAADPLHFDKPSIAGVGIGSTFGPAMAEADPEVTIGLIPAAVGGTPLSRWVPGQDLYEQAVARARPTLEQGTLRGILWHQGEGDSNHAELAGTYADRLAATIAGLRRDLDAPEVPFVVGQLGLFLKPERSPYADEVNRQLQRLVDTVPHTALVSAEGLEAKADGVHFNAASYREFGRRYAKAMQSLQEP